MNENDEIDYLRRKWRAGEASGDENRRCRALMLKKDQAFHKPSLGLLCSLGVVCAGALYFLGWIVAIGLAMVGVCAVIGFLTSSKVGGNTDIDD